MTGGPHIAVTVRDGVARVLMNRPESRNAMTVRMVAEAHTALAGLATRDDVHLVVLTGAGTSFCPGADLDRYGDDAEAAERDRGEMDPQSFQVPTLLHEMPQVTLAAINGACAGSGLGWACACDLRVAVDSARFNTAFLQVGVAGDMAGPWTLTRLLGAARARELYLLPDRFDAAEALRIGLLNRVFPADTWSAELDGLVHRLAGYRTAALRALKANFLAAETGSLRDYVALETERHIDLTSGEDTRRAFRTQRRGI